MSISITLPDSSVRQYESSVSSLDIAKSISEGLARNVLAAKVNGQIVDAARPITTDATLQLLTWNDEEGNKKNGNIPILLEKLYGFRI